MSRPERESERRSSKIARKKYRKKARCRNTQQRSRLGL
jgi:hypothetical protein